MNNKLSKKGIKRQDINDIFSLYILSVCYTRRFQFLYIITKSHINKQTFVTVIVYFFVTIRNVVVVGCLLFTHQLWIEVIRIGSVHSSLTRSSLIITPFLELLRTLIWSSQDKTPLFTFVRGGGERERGAKSVLNTLQRLVNPNCGRLCGLVLPRMTNDHDPFPLFPISHIQWPSSNDPWPTPWLNI